MRRALSRLLRWLAAAFDPPAPAESERQPQIPKAVMAPEQMRVPFEPAAPLTVQQADARIWWLYQDGWGPINWGSGPPLTHHQGGTYL